MTARKITISLDEELFRELERSAERAGLPRSKWLKAAVQRAVDRELNLAALNVLLDKAERPRASKAARKKKSSRRGAH